MDKREVMAGVAAGTLLFMHLQDVNILPLLFVAGLAAVVYFSRGAGAGGKTFAAFEHGREEADLTSFEDIGGQDVAKNELREALDFIKDIGRIKALGIRPLKGILLSGPPGTGKTLLAKAAARFTGSAFVSASGSEFVEMYVGVGAQRVRQLFTQARSQAKKHRKSSAVVFVDEIEVLGGKRGAGGSHLEYDQTLNELLVQMDGLSMEDDIRVLVIGATNRVDILDPALMRPGRFDRVVKVDLPDKAGRMRILELHTRNKPVADEVRTDALAGETFGFSGAHLESVANEAAILALRENSELISMPHLRAAIEKVLMGEKLERTPGADEKRRIAVHEAGHALASEIVQPGSVASVNVASRGNALGYVRQTQMDDQYLYTRAQLEDRIIVALAGAVAEDTVLGCRSTGASNDFAQAADVARRIVHGGMSALGIISPDDLPARLLHETVAGILRDLEKRTGDLLESRREVLDRLTAELLSRESLSGGDVRNLLAGDAPAPVQ